MPVIASANDAHATRRRASSNGTGFWLTTYIGGNRYAPAVEAAPDPSAIYPMAFLVEQDPDAVVGAHYHQADQFQVIVDGAGRLGTHGVGPGSVHFAGAWSAYGPLAAGGKGLHYFTLRNGWDPGARYMEHPDNRTMLRARPRKHREVVGFIAPLADGLCTRQLDVPADGGLTGPDPSTGSGQFWVVLSGALSRDGCKLPARSCVFVRPDELPFTAIAGPQGLRALLLQFPKKN